MSKGYKCPHCSEQKGTYLAGHYRCGNNSCEAVWWEPFDRPEAIGSGKGYECHNCKRQTMFFMERLGDAALWRCSTCGSGQLTPFSEN